MGFYSRKDIEQAIDSGQIMITSPTEVELAQVSINIGLGELYRQDKIMELVLGGREEHMSFERLDFDEFLDQYCSPLSFEKGYEILPHRGLHVAKTEEYVRIPHTIQKSVTSRTRYARLFLDVREDYDLGKGHSFESFEGHIPLILNTLGPGVKLYKGERYAQLFLEDGEIWLHDNDFIKALFRREVCLQRNDNALMPWDYCVGNRLEPKIRLTLSPDIRILKSNEPFDPHQDSAERFEEIRLPYNVFVHLPKETNFLASSAEKIKLSENYIAGLDEVSRPFGSSHIFVHTNAPYHNPCSEGTLTLECHCNTGVDLMAGMPIALLKVWKMKSPAEPYESSYTKQNGVLESLSHEGR